MNHLKPFLQKETLLDTTIFLMPVFFIEIVFYVGEFFVLFQYHQIFKLLFVFTASKLLLIFIFYNAPLFSVQYFVIIL